MKPITMPRLQLLKHSQLGEDSYHSMLISLLRGLAAIQVAAAHLRAEVFPGLRTVADPSAWYVGLAFITGFAHQAVIAFFLISGWLVGGSLLNKLAQPHAIKFYAIDRITRLWTVLVPTFLLMLVFGMLMQVLDPRAADYSPANEFSVLSFVGNLLGLQTVRVPNFGGNYALWSLANETWYYVLFPLLLLAGTARRVASRAASAAAIVLIVTFLPYAISLYFAIWLLGAAFSRIRIDCGKGTRIALLLLLGALMGYFRIAGNNDDLGAKTFVQDLLISLPLLCLLSSMQIRPDPAVRLLKPAAAVARFFADFSFTLYVLHIPLIFMLQHLGRVWFGRDHLSPTAPLDLAVYLGMLATLLAGAYLSYLLFESQTYRIRRLAKRGLVGRNSEASSANVRMGG